MEESITTILVDDEQDSRVVLRRLLVKYFPQVAIIGEASNVEEAYRLIVAAKPQLVFLDIQMPRASGFNLLSKFTPVPFEVVFVTSYDQYAINAIRFNALDYLLKPVDTAELQHAVTKAINCIAQKTDNNVQIVSLLHSLSPHNQDDRKIAVHAGEKVKMLEVRNILLIEADGRYCRLTMQNGEAYITTKYLKEFEDYLAADTSFIRINKSLILRVNAIKEYSKGYPCFIETVTGKTFEIPRRKKQEVLEKLREMR